MSNVIPFPTRNNLTRLQVEIWQHHKGYHVTVFDDGHERDNARHLRHGQRHGSVLAILARNDHQSRGLA